MMKKFVLTSILCLGLVLAACSTAGSGASSATSQASGGVLNANYDNAVSVEMQLAFGTLQLEGSANAVSSETAAQLLPLWKAVRSLSASDGAAQEEIQAVYRQIEESMSAEQLQAIATMQLTASDMRQMAGDLGLAAGGPGGMTGTPDATMQAAQASGQAPADFAAGMPAGLAAGMGGDPAVMAGGGGMPAGGAPGGMPGTGSGSTSGATGSTSAKTGSASANPVVDAVITYLQGKLG